MKTEGPNFFTGDQWSNEAVAAWLACFIDHAGSIEQGSQSVSVTLESRDHYMLRALYERFNVGQLHLRSGQRAVHTWRVSEPDHVRRVLATALRYLTTSHSAASQALDKLAEITATTRAREQRDREIVVLWLQGQSSQAAIARAFGVSTAIVAAAIAKHQRGPVSPADALIDEREH